VSKVVSFRIDKENEKIINSFKNALIRKYGKLHRVWGSEITRAVEQYLATLNAPAHTQIPAKTSAFHRRLAEIFTDLPNGEPFAFDFLYRVIEKHAGGDSRTLLKYRRSLEAWELIFRAGSGLYRRGPMREWISALLEPGVIGGKTT